MKTLNEWNNKVNFDTMPANVACDYCGTEMEYTNYSVALLTNPIQRQVRCPKCEILGYKNELV